MLLGRAGHSVNVYERSASGLIGRGGGVATSRKLLNELRANDVLDTDFPATPFSELKMSKWTDNDPYVGRCPLSKAIDMHCVHWSGLWENLRKRVPDAAYHRGRTLVDARADDTGKVTLSFSDGQTELVDLVLFADGYQSLGRKLLFPDIDISYRGYAVWRGVLPDSEVDDLAPLSQHPRYSFKTIKGSFVSYIVPSREGSVEPGQRTINWAAYIPLPEDQVADFMIDNEGRSRQGSIPSGSMREEQDADLKALMARELPRYYSDILAKSKGNQIQLIYTSSLPAYGKGRMALIGDAGMVVQPLTGAGVFKGYTNVRDLLVMLQSHDDVDAALESWSEEETRIAHRMLELGGELEEAFIWNTIDLASASSEECERWWEKSITVPEEFSYFAA
ncbi:MAG: hypothetical protein ABJN26_08295 [Stappiaceae bacterium]